ncbi:hypothetical protein HPB47_016938 [Ixodes persulcatus]|uniref:Uncharacterized protein n=1 Tax=Ixodes persulcatus TaxID=34615 RepID=A0AC60QQK7_IXOPE|nr:hypothetical protein HPB47_016938 [Ixodes persulcatus]
MTQLLADRANTIGDALLRELFLQRLPTNFQMVLATAPALDLIGLAALADAVIDVATPSVANAVTVPACLRPTGLREVMKTTAATRFINISGTQTLEANNNCRRAHQRRALHHPSSALPLHVTREKN